MKTIGASLNTHLQGSTTNLAMIVKVTRRDGEIFGLTGHDRALTYLGLRYETGAAAPQLAALVRSAGVNVDNSDVDGALSDVVTYEDIEAGDWFAARLEIMRVNWADLTMGAETIAVGELGQAQHDGRGFKVEFMGRTHKLGRVITRQYLPTCDADLGDARCGVDIEPLAITGSVTNVTSNRIFEDAGTGFPSPDNYHDYGKLLWLTGANAGRGMEVKTQVGGLFTLQLGMKRTITVGDTYKAYPGCNKLKKTGVLDIGSPSSTSLYQGDCVVKFNNAINFRGFDEIPGIDKIVRPAGTK